MKYRLSGSYISQILKTGYNAYISADSEAGTAARKATIEQIDIFNEGGDIKGWYSPKWLLKKIVNKLINQMNYRAEYPNGNYDIPHDKFSFNSISMNLIYEFDILMKMKDLPDYFIKAQTLKVTALISQMTMCWISQNHA